MELIDWYLEKTATNRKHQIETHSRATVKQLTSKTDEESIQKVRQLRRQIKSVLPDNYPQNLQKGDVVWVNHGQGYAGEISDGHYGILLTRKGSNFLVAPLTKTRQPDKENTMEVTNLGLPARGGQTVETCYVNFGQMKFVHYRRLQNIIGLSVRKNVAGQLPDLLTKFNNIINKSI